MTEWIGIVYDVPPEKGLSMELVFNPTRRITTAEMYVTCEPPIEFEVRTIIPRPTRRLMTEWQEAGATDPAAACEIIGQVFVSVKQNGNAYPLKSRAEAEALKAAVDEANPGEGDGFVCAVLDGFINNHYSFFMRDRANSAT